MLAKLGMTGPMSVLEGQRGFLNAFSSSPNPRPILEGLGSDFEVLKIAFKPYGCCRLVHSSIDAITALKNKHGLKPESLDRVTINTCSQMSKFNNPRPHDIMSAQFSIPFGVALAMVDGSNLPKDYIPENLERKDLLDFCGKVRVVADTSMDDLYPDIIGARATIEVKGEGEVTEYVKFPKGEPENPMSREALLEKFRSLISTILPEERAQRIETAVEGLEEMEDIRQLTELLSTETGGGS
jgi:2-methylcitrate dehydratase PrpD